MARPPKPVRFSAEDYADAPEGVAPVLEKLFLQLNPFLADATGAVEGRLTVGDNIAGGYKTAEVVVPAVTWTNATYAAGWATNGTDEAVAVRLEGSTAIAKGLAARAAGSTTNDLIATLPTGYAPAKRSVQRVFANHSGGESDATVVIGTNGEIRFGTVAFTTFTHVSLDGLTWTPGTPPAPAVFSGPGWPIVLKTDASATPEGVDVAFVRDLDSDAASHDARSVDWRPDGKGNLLIRRVGGLTPGRRYQITFRFLA